MLKIKWMFLVFSIEKKICVNELLLHWINDEEEEKEKKKKQKWNTFPERVKSFLFINCCLLRALTFLLSVNGIEFFSSWFSLIENSTKSRNWLTCRIQQLFRNAFNIWLSFFFILMRIDASSLFYPSIHLKRWHAERYEPKKRKEQKKRLSLN